MSADTPLSPAEMRDIAQRVDAEGPEPAFAAAVEAEIKRPPHRPVGSTRTERTAVLPQVRCTPAQRETWEALGGADWLRAQLDRAAKRR